MLSLGRARDRPAPRPADRRAGRAAGATLTGRPTVSGRTLVIASANVDKAAEIAEILGTVADLTLLPCPVHVPDVEETGNTLEANARLKARALCDATGSAAVADDTGLEVEALGVPPASTRHGTPARAPPTPRTWPRCSPSSTGWVPRRRRTDGPGSAVSPSWPIPTGPSCGWRARSPAPSPPRPVVTAGSGTTRSSHRTGYDGRTFAQMTAAEKHAVSHRGRAFRALAARLDGGEA